MFLYILGPLAFSDLIGKTFPCWFCGFLLPAAIVKENLKSNSAVTCSGCQGTMSAKDIKETLSYDVDGRNIGSGNDHTQRYHGRIQSSSDRSRDGIPCPECGKQFKFISFLKRHLLSHSDNKEFKSFSCPLCRKRFKHKYHMKTHMKICKFPCDTY